ncbi:MAG: hypothetical protein FWG82_05300, partial [Oscillospiraceae bacterium]|nr:hypothetical protein [Oscillospiraceae bacterium]
DTQKETSLRVTSDEYLRQKFGKLYQTIVENISPALQLSCQTAESKKHLMLVNPQNGDFLLYGKKSGLILREDRLECDGYPVTSPVFAGGYCWGVCMKKNAVVCYETSEWTHYFKILKDVDEPLHLCSYTQPRGDIRLYVCLGDGRIRSFSTVISKLDFQDFDEHIDLNDFLPLPGYRPLRYFRLGHQHYISFADGVCKL